MKLSNKAKWMILEFVVENGIGLIYPEIGLAVALCLLIFHLCCDKDMPSECHCSLEQALSSQPALLSLTQCQESASLKAVNQEKRTNEASPII